MPRSAPRVRARLAPSSSPSGGTETVRPSMSSTRCSSAFAGRPNSAISLRRCSLRKRTATTRNGAANSTPGRCASVSRMSSPRGSANARRTSSRRAARNCTRTVSSIESSPNWPTTISAQASAIARIEAAARSGRRSRLRRIIRGVGPIQCAMPRRSKSSRPKRGGAGGRIASAGGRERARRTAGSVPNSEVARAVTIEPRIVAGVSANSRTGKWKCRW